MSNIKCLLESKVRSSLSYNEALATLAGFYDDIPDTIKESIIYMVQTAQTKEKGLVKLNNPFKLASLFRAKKELRYYLNYIYSSGECLVASTGYVLISVPHKCEPGFYSDTGILVEGPEFSKYPDFNRHLASINKDKSYVISDFKIGGVVGKNKYLILEGVDIAFDGAYINLIKRVGVKEVYLLNLNKGLYFKSPAFEGLVMSMRV